MKILVFDTETTGLPKSKIVSESTTHLWPFILQLSYIIYDTQIKEIVLKYDSIIHLDDPSEISNESFKIHNISSEKSHKSSVTIDLALSLLLNSITHVDLIVGHNIDFDINMINIEILRLKESFIPKHILKQALLRLNQKINVICTMKSNCDLCGLKRKNRYGHYNKYPTLSELHYHFFNFKPTNLHNSLHDVLVTLRCYIKSSFNYDIYEISSIKPLFNPIL